MVSEQLLNRGDVMISMSSPLYLHPSESPGTLISTTIFNGENYDNWANSVRNGLVAKNKLAFIDGLIEKPAGNDDGTPSEEEVAWRRCNAMVMAWIRNVVDAKLHASISYTNTAVELWNELKARYNIGNAPRVHELKTELAELKQEGLNVVEYYTKLKAIWDELENHSKVPKCTCGSAVEFLREREEEKVHKFLMGLNTEIYGVMRSQLLGQEPMPNMSTAYSSAIREERHKNISRAGDNKVQQSALAVRGGWKSNSKQSDWGRDEEKIICTHCGKEGHDISDCFTLNGFPPNWGRGRGASRGRGRRGGYNGRGNGRGNQWTHTAAAVTGNSSAAQGENGEPSRQRGDTLSGFSQEQRERILALIEPSKSTDKLQGPIYEDFDWCG